MEYRINVNGTSPIIMHNVFSAFDDTLPEKQERDRIHDKRKKVKADHARLAELDAYLSIWFTDQGAIGIPQRALRTMIEEAAKVFTQGPAVRGGLRVIESNFDYDHNRYGTTAKELADKARWTIPGADWESNG